MEGPSSLDAPPIGRTTVDVLAVNLGHLVQLHKALLDEGVFSPDSDSTQQPASPFTSLSLSGKLHE